MATSSATSQSDTIMAKSIVSEYFGVEKGSNGRPCGDLPIMPKIGESEEQQHV